MTANLAPNSADIWLIRHAPARDGGAMAGRRDVPAHCDDHGRLAAVTAYIGLNPKDNLITSPALRCRQTAQALFANHTATPDGRLWEQDFGAWEGVAYADLPDLGQLSQPQLAAYAPPQGESFADLAQRIQGPLCALGAGRHVIVAHAGVIRAGLGLALGEAHLGLGFMVAPLSITRLGRDTQSGQWTIHTVNWTVP